MRDLEERGFRGWWVGGNFEWGVLRGNRGARERERERRRSLTASLALRTHTHTRNPGKNKQAKVMRAGTDVTLVAFSKMVGFCLQAADALAAEGISAEVRRCGCFGHGGAAAGALLFG